MSIDHTRCYVVTCDTCRTTFDETGADYVVHFDTPDEAIGYITEHGWTLTDSGEPRCLRCTARIGCDRDGHDFSLWHPCACNGRIPDHALYGCGLLRFCFACDHHETATLATLPTTAEPHTFGR
ncbi:hypothetical protein K1T35_02660 [Pseudonocardia sp. DSM 110487]|uniref:hypothetical protein n=1 Tax=Pseudonocardia sp. DSM 110487 TaxID=2865833 RepID=UPI001C6A50BE|nr:hypothetical protein [Pseudonocardia sp. DSM 110487]QYN36252.1 hypothetical protein K1T35_02660 [Pseudonocardia sp. DSM 110487]